MLIVADSTTWVERFMERIFRLYEQEPSNKIEKRLGEYVLRWVCWVNSGLRISLDKKDRTKQMSCLFHIVAKNCLSLKLFPSKSCQLSAAKLIAAIKKFMI